MKFDTQELNLMFGDDTEIFYEIFADFKDSADEMVSKIEEAINSKNSADLEISAHTLKGVLSTFCSTVAKEISFELEMKGKNGDFDGCAESLETLKVEVTALIDELGSYQFSNAA